MVKLIAAVNDTVPPQQPYDFSFVRQAEQQLNKQAESRDGKNTRNLGARATLGE